MKRVLQIIDGMNRAGAETMLMNIYRTIDHSQVQFDFVIYRKERQDYEDEIEALGGRVLRISAKNPVRMTYEIRKILKSEGPYIAIHSHTLLNNAFAMLAALGLNVVRISHSHNTQSVVNESIIYRVYESITKLLIRIFSQKWLACGELAGYYLFGKAFVKRGKIINNSVDSKRFAEVNFDAVSAIREQYGLKEKLVIGNIGRLELVKNHAWQIEIAKVLKAQNVDFKMLFIGRGSLDNELCETIKKNGLQEQVLLLGVRSDIPELLHAMDVFLMPSYFEGNPVTLVESQAAGTPCVIADHITDEIDLHIGLCSRCSLNDNATVWAHECMEAKNKRIDDFDIIYNALCERGYNLKINTKTLLSEYGL